VALVVIRVQVEERCVVRDGFVGAAGVREQSGQNGPRPHSGVGFGEAPEAAEPETIQQSYATLVPRRGDARLRCARYGIRGCDVLDPRLWRFTADPPCQFSNFST
jgi:hypothetical protein